MFLYTVLYYTYTTVSARGIVQGELQVTRKCCLPIGWAQFE